MSKSTSLQFDHIAVPVSDAKSACELFADVLQAPLVAAHTGDDWDGAPWLMMIFGLADGGQIALCARRGARKHRQSATDLPHYALTVSAPGQLEAWAKRLKAAGFAIRREDHGDQRSIYFDDRCGLTWELTTPRAAAPGDPDAQSIVEQWIGKRVSASD